MDDSVYEELRRLAIQTKAQLKENIINEDEAYTLFKNLLADFRKKEEKDIQEEQTKSIQNLFNKER